MIEFALSFGLLVFALLSCVAAAIWSIESSAAVTAAEIAARLSISVQGAGAAAAQVSTTQAVSRTAGPYRLLKSTMFGTPLVVSDTNCSPTAALPTDSVTLCSSSVGRAEKTVVTVRVYGCARSVVPVPFIGGCPGGIAVDQLIVIHAPVFQQ